jgi:hypothetical protein
MTPFYPFQGNLSEIGMSNGFNEMKVSTERERENNFQIPVASGRWLCYSERVADSGIWGIARPQGL